ncbi:MAG: succinate dehydrogenase iron-sulfur subunit [Proteobacteria bacterium]|nr:succinate dehydrogenase iron-sulfur subunit [Pseudomonadota bacterium]
METIFRIHRFNPETDREPFFREYRLDAEPNLRVLDCLNRIKWEHDGGLSYRMSCAHGVCGSCAVKINGRCTLACQTLVRDVAGDVVTIEPLPSFKVVKDLIVDLDAFMARVACIRPFLLSHGPVPDRERPQSPEERKKIDEVIRCILCACCTGACPVSQGDPNYLGPAPLVQAFRRIFDSRDDETSARLAQMDAPDAAWGCVNHFECTRVCPKRIPITKSINFIKREIEKTRDQQIMTEINRAEKRPED